MRAVQKDVNVSLFNQRKKPGNGAGNGLPRSVRLSDPEMIRKTLQQKPTLSNYIAKHFSPGESSGLALTVPKKMAKRAVDRNKVKRIIREIFRQAQARDNGAVVFKLKKPVGRATQGKLRQAEYQLLKQEIESLMK